MGRRPLRSQIVDLNFKTALVTGGGAGIGRATAQALANAGCAVVVADMNEAAGQETVDLIEQEGGRGAFILTDVTSWDDIERMVSFTTDKFGGLHVFHNNAGINTGWPEFPKAGRERWEKVVDVNLWAVIAGIQAVTPVMEKGGGGAIVNMASLAGITPFGPDPIYSATKHAVVGLTRSLAGLREEMNIRVNCLCPGFVDTTLPRRRLNDMPPEERARWADAVDKLPMMTTDEIAEAALELVKDDALSGGVMAVLYGGVRKLIPVAIH